jgi:putative acetyltransferase
MFRASVLLQLVADAEPVWWQIDRQPPWQERQMNITLERPGDTTAIHHLIQSAFRRAPHTSGTEARIVDALRAEGALTVSLIAVDGSEILGHAAFSPITIPGASEGWLGLGPVSVAPERQGEGIGKALISAGLQRLRTAGAPGCVVLGDPAYYGRFGFTYDPELTYGRVRPGYFQRLVFNGPDPKGEVRYHTGFDVS